MSKVIHVSGKRRKAIARATLKPGKGVIRINSMLLQNYNPELSKMKIMEPLLIAGEDVIKKININVNTFGGGYEGQAEAARLAIARGLVQFTGSKELEKNYLSYDRQLLVADVRQRESRKPNTHSKARQKVQKSYRWSSKTIIVSNLYFTKLQLFPKCLCDNFATRVYKENNRFDKIDESFKYYVKTKEIGLIKEK